MKKIVLGLAGASVALGALAATPASAADFRGQDRGLLNRFRAGAIQAAPAQNRFAQNQDLPTSESCNFAESRNRNFSQNRFVTSRYTGFDNGSQARQWQRGDHFDSQQYAMTIR